MPSAERRAAAVAGAAELVADYQRWLAGAGRGSRCYRDAARAFLGRWPDPAAFAAEPLTTQLRLTAAQRPFLTYLMLHGHCRPGFRYLAHRKIGGLLAAAGRSPLAGDLARFTAAATDLDYSGHVIKRAAERVVARLLIQTGRPLAALTAADLQELTAAFRDCAEAKDNASSWANDRALISAAHRVLFHLGVLAQPPADPRRRPGLGGHYSGVAEPLRGLLLDYCAQAAATRAPATVKSIASHLAGFGRFLTRLRPAGHRPGRAGPARAHRTLAGLAGRRPASGRAGALDRAPARADPHRPPVPRRHHRVGLARRSGPAAAVRPGHPRRPAPAAPLPAPGRRPPAGRRARAAVRIRTQPAGPAARRRAAAHPRHRAAHR